MKIAAVLLLALGAALMVVATLVYVRRPREYAWRTTQAFRDWADAGYPEDMEFRVTLRTDDWTRSHATGLHAA